MSLIQETRRAIQRLEGLVLDYDPGPVVIMIANEIRRDLEKALKSIELGPDGPKDDRRFIWEGKLKGTVYRLQQFNHELICWRQDPSGWNHCGYVESSRVVQHALLTTLGA